MPLGGGKNHSEVDRRERAQLQPEAGRRARELLSSAPSGGGHADLLDHLGAPCSSSASAARTSALGLSADRSPTQPKVRFPPDSAVRPRLPRTPGLRRIAAVRMPVVNESNRRN